MPWMSPSDAARARRPAVSCPTTGNAAGASGRRSGRRTGCAAPGPTRPVNARVTTVARKLAETSASRWAGAGAGLGRAQQRRSDLYGGRAGVEDGADLRAGGQPAGHHQRDADERSHGREQCRGVEVVRGGRDRVRAAVPAGVAACRHTGVGADGLRRDGPSGLVALTSDRACRRRHRWTSGGGGQPKWQGDHRDAVAESSRRRACRCQWSVPCQSGAGSVSPAASASGAAARRSARPRVGRRGACRSARTG